MPNEWRALERVGENLGLKDEELREFLSITGNVYKDKVRHHKESYRLKDEYFDFLQYEVLSDDKVLDFLKQLNVKNSEIRKLESAEFSISDSFRTNYLFSFGLDEVVDFIMLMKLIRDYQDITGLGSLSPPRPSPLSNLLSER